jgi:hypothetical protein
MMNGSARAAGSAVTHVPASGVDIPLALERVFERFITTEYTTVDAAGQPITWPVTPYHRPGEKFVSVTTGVPFPKKAKDAIAHPKVSLLFSDPTGSGISDPPTVLVQGTAIVDDADLEANRRRYERDSMRKFPEAFRSRMLPPLPMKRLLGWYYFTRIYIHVHPVRIYVWPGGDCTAEPEVISFGMEPDPSGARADTGPAAEAAWDERMDALANLSNGGVLSFVASDGFPFAARVSLRLDATERAVRIPQPPRGAALRPGPACLTAHHHDQGFTYMQNFQVRGELDAAEDGWVLRPRRLVGGLGITPARGYRRALEKWALLWRYRRIAVRSLYRRAVRGLEVTRRGAAS